MKTLKYLGFYAENDLLGKRVLTPSVTNKMDYIIDALKESGFSSWVISPVNIVSRKYKFEKGYTKDLSSKCRVTYFNSIYGDFLVYKILGKFIISWQIIMFLFRNVKKGETILVYHHPFFFIPLFLCKSLKKINIVLEVEEIYQNIWPLGLIDRINENLLLRIADQYIVVSEILANKFPQKSKIIIHGSYKQNESVYKDFRSSSSINILYGGSIDRQRNAAFYAVECAKLLPDNYIMHICGYGSSLDIKDILAQIDTTNKNAGKEKCVFHGLLLGEDYKKLLNHCDIALNIQNNYYGINYSLPSKIFTYLSADLKIITTRLASLEESPFSGLFEYIDNTSPEEIAEVIKGIDLSKKSDARSIMDKLHRDVCLKLSLMFS